MRHDHAVRNASNPWRVSLDEHPGRSSVQRPPAAPSLTRVIAGTAAPAHTAPAPSPPRWSHSRDEQLPALIELDTLDDRHLDAQQGAKYPGVAHAVLRSLDSDLDKPET
jgi:hypothetical protein